MNIQINNFLKIINTTFTGNINDLISADWQDLYNYAKQQALLPLFLEGCHQYPEYQMNQLLFREKLLMESMEIILYQSQRTQSFLSVYDKLTAEGIKPLVLKGLICRFTYGILADHRPSVDEDIYIMKEDFETCKDVLTANGFIMESIIITEAVLSNIQHISFINNNTGLRIEVHLNLMGIFNSNRRKMNSFFQDAFTTCIVCNIEGHQIYSMNYTEHFLFLFLHFYKHFTSSGVGIRQLIDICIYDKRYHELIDWGMVEMRIKEMSADKLYADIMFIGKEYLGFELDSKFQGYCAEALLEDMMEAGVHGKTTKEQVLSGRVASSAMENSDSILRLIFPKVSTLSMGYPILYDKPYLIPIMWIRRLIKFVCKMKLYDNKLARNGLEIGKRRVRLLKEYRII